MDSDIPSSRFDRQERLSLWDQKLIEKITVLVVGVGGTGSEVCKNLSLLGIGKLILVDVDSIEYSNLNRQMLFSKEDIGQNKAEVAKVRILHHFNPELEVEVFPFYVQEIPDKTFESVDVIAGCVDNYLARQFLNSIAIEHRIPLIDSATDGYLGQVQSIIPFQTACLACDNPPPPQETQVLMEPCSIVGVPRSREHCAWKALYEFNTLFNRKPNETEKDLEKLTQLANEYTERYNFGKFERKELLQLIMFHVPSLITVNAVTSGIQTQEIIKTIFSIKRRELRKSERLALQQLETLTRFKIPSLSIYSALTGTLNTFDLVQDPECTVCGNMSNLTQKIEKIKINKKNSLKTIINGFSEKFNKEFIAFKGNSVLQEDRSLESLLRDGDRITLSSKEDEQEFRVRITFTPPRKQRKKE
ncbi:MAG: ThiF family adenylyltransferase [Candidatus Heimdallarchaeota archaeon]|nr:ThiF family adenylyltransferase [Candidatus Heimdallarchaeota archaeon]